jgi:tetratricopeptide (TPR) repeat protein
MRRPLALTLALALAGTAAAQPAQRPGFWARAANPHAEEVAALLARGRQLRGQAQYQSEPFQTPLRERLLAQALESYRRAMALAPDQADVALETADVAYEASDYAAAAAAYARVAELEPSEQRMPVALRHGVALAHLGRLDEAQAVLERGQGWGSGSGATQLLWALGYVYMAEGRLDDALDAFARADAAQRASGNADPAPLLALAIAYDRDEQIGRALEVAEQARQLDPAFAFLMMAATTSQWQGTAGFFAPASDRHYWFAFAYEALGQLPEARAEWRAYLASPSPTYRLRAQEHLRQVDAALAKRRPKGKPR